MIRNKFPYDQDNRIQKLYYDINIHTICNRTKLQNIKNKFYKYENYLNKNYYNGMQLKLLELEIKRDEAYKECQLAKRIAFLHNPIHESHKKREALVPIFRKANDEYEKMKRERQVWVRHEVENAFFKLVKLCSMKKSILRLKFRLLKNF